MRKIIMLTSITVVVLLILASTVSATGLDIFSSAADSASDGLIPAEEPKVEVEPVVVEEEESGTGVSESISSSSKLVPPANKPPVAICDVTPDNVKVNQKFVLDGSDSYDPDGWISRYYWWFMPLNKPGAWWDIGFGGPKNWTVTNFTFTSEIMEKVKEYTGNYTYKYIIILCVVDNEDEFHVWTSYANHSVNITNGTSVPPQPHNEEELPLYTVEPGMEVGEPKIANHAPIVDFTWSPTTPEIDETVTFDATASYDPDGEIVEYWWFLVFEDQGCWEHMSWDLVPVINYTFSDSTVDNSSSSYEVLLVARDNDGAETWKQKTVVIQPPQLKTQAENQPPVAICDVIPDSAIVNLTILLDGSASYDPDGWITEYHWYWRWTNYTGWWVGINQTSSATYSFSFDKAGDYTIILAVVDNEGETHVWTSYCNHTVNVSSVESIPPAVIEENQSPLFVDMLEVETDSQDSQQLESQQTSSQPEPEFNSVSLGLLHGSMAMLL